MPVDFEIVNIDPQSDGNLDLEYVITSIKRNGVAIKGWYHCFQLVQIMIS